jgi:hypothetical protein
MKKSLVMSHESWVSGRGAWVIIHGLRPRPYSLLCYLVFHFSLITFHFSAAQTLHVVTKTVERTFEYKPNETVQIYAERSDVEISTWGRNEVKITVELLAKHPDRATAQKDLEVLRYVAEKSGRTITLRNFVVLPPNATQKPQSNLKTRYVLLLPATCQVEIQNSFGKTTLRGLQKDTRLRTEFCINELADLKGKLTLHAYFGELKVLDFEGNMNLTTDRTDVLVRAPRGQCRVRTQHGSLEVAADRTQVKLDIETKNTELKNGTVAKK